MKNLISILAAAMVIVGLSISCVKDNSSNQGGSSSDSGSGSGSGSGSSSSIAGTTWATADQVGFGTLTLTFTASDCTLKRTNGSSSESCTYPYTFSGNTVKTKVKLSVWSGGAEEEATGTVSGNNMSFKLSKNGSNYAFSKK